MLFCKSTISLMRSLNSWTYS